MPTLKARVFCDHLKHPASLVDALRELGYQVEVLRPEASPSSPADLDIALETCARAEVLGRAAELAADQGADVVVAPGALTMASPQLETGSLPAQSISSEPSVGVETHAPVLRLDQAEQRPTESAATEPETAEANADPGFWRRAVPAAAVRLSVWATAAGEVLASARDQARESREHALTRLAHVRAQREEHLLELTHQRIEAQERASHLAAARRNAAAYLDQLQQESGGRIQTLRGSSELEPRTDAPPPWLGLIEKFRERIRPVRWDTALAGLASAGALFAIGLAVASFNSKPPLSAHEDRDPAVTSSPASAPRPSSPATPATKSAARSSPGTHARAAKPSPAQRGPSKRDRTVASRDQGAANDVVVRRIASPTPTPKVQAQQGWKHFSDLDH